MRGGDHSKERLAAQRQARRLERDPSLYERVKEACRGQRKHAPQRWEAPRVRLCGMLWGERNG